jgi:hypothetical protein
VRCCAFSRAEGNVLGEGGEGGVGAVWETGTVPTRGVVREWLAWHCGRGGGAGLSAEDSVRLAQGRSPLSLSLTHKVRSQPHCAALHGRFTERGGGERVGVGRRPRSLALTTPCPPSAVPPRWVLLSAYQVRAAVQEGPSTGALAGGGSGFWLGMARGLLLSVHWSAPDTHPHKLFLRGGGRGQQGAGGDAASAAAAAAAAAVGGEEEEEEDAVIEVCCSPELHLVAALDGGGRVGYAFGTSAADMGGGASALPPAAAPGSGTAAGAAALEARGGTGAEGGSALTRGAGVGARRQMHTLHRYGRGGGGRGASAAAGRRDGRRMARGSERAAGEAAAAAAAAGWATALALSPAARQLCVGLRSGGVALWEVGEIAGRHHDHHHHHHDHHHHHHDHDHPWRVGGWC